MTMKLFAVRDVKADAFGAPMSIATEGLARRSFLEACHNPQSELAKYPTDYQLYQLGEYDPNSGLLSACTPTPKYIMSAVEARAESLTKETVKEVA